MAIMGIAEAVLICALALPTVNFVEPPEMTVSQFLREYKELQSFLAHIDPSGEFVVMPKRIHAVPKGYAVLPFQWRSHHVYIKRGA
jgi:hypothetical protein